MPYWVQAKAARILGATPRQVGYALRRHSIEVKKFPRSHDVKNKTTPLRQVRGTLSEPGPSCSGL